MNILYYISGNNIDYLMIEELKGLDEIRVFSLDEPIKDYHADADFSLKLMQQIHRDNIDAVLTIDYYPIISMVCDVVKIPYLSWIEDCPMLTLMSKTLGNECNYVFNFDRLYREKIEILGCRHSLHMPLGGTASMSKILDFSSFKVDEKSKYHNEIAFVGSLYTDKKRNRFRGLKLSERTAGYLEGLIKAQELIYGYNLIYESLPEEIVNEYSTKADLKLGDMYFQDVRGLVADSIGIEVTARDREKLLLGLSEIGGVSLYTGSDMPENLKKAGVNLRGKVKYAEEMPFVFKNSRINLNISSRTIESGVPRRVFDILMCGGFCLTNYQPEVAELFEDGVDLVMYTSMEDAVNKAAYYLEHEDERVKIAENGYKKVCECYTVRKYLEEIIGVLGEEIS